MTYFPTMLRRRNAIGVNSMRVKSGSKLRFSIDYDRLLGDRHLRQPAPARPAPDNCGIVDIQITISLGVFNSSILILWSDWWSRAYLWCERDLKCLMWEGGLQKHRHNVFKRRVLFAIGMKNLKSYRYSNFYCKLCFMLLTLPATNRMN